MGGEINGSSRDSSKVMQITHCFSSPDFGQKRKIQTSHATLKTAAKIFQSIGTNLWFVLIHLFEFLKKSVWGVFYNSVTFWPISVLHKLFLFLEHKYPSGRCPNPSHPGCLPQAFAHYRRVCGSKRRRCLETDLWQKLDHKKFPSHLWHVWVSGREEIQHQYLQVRRML